MAKFHVNDEGNPGRCSAKEGACPFGEAAPHFDTERDARAHYEAMQAGKATFTIAKPEPEAKPWRIAHAVDDLKEMTFESSNPVAVENFRLHLARIEGAHSWINTPSYYKTLSEALPCAKKVLGHKTYQEGEYTQLRSFIQNAELSIANAELKGGYTPPVAVVEPRENQFEKRPSNAKLNGAYRELVASLPDANEFGSTGAPTEVANLFNAFTRRSVPAEQVRAISDELRKKIKKADGWKNGSYSTDFERQQVEGAIKAIYPDGQMFTKKFGGAALGSSAKYLNGLENLLDDLDEYVDSR